ncbi:MAG: metal ABC transporter solute-binding protein, Zn/Mn family, partial [Planctomycetaceae bacterium]
MSIICPWIMRARPAAMAVLLGLLVAGCDSGSEVFSRTRQSSEPIAVVCTTGMVADVVRNVGGNQVQVTQLMGEGIDPHTYQSSTGDVTKLNDADMIFYSGLHLEANLQSVFDSLARSKPVFALTAELERWHRDRLIATAGDQHDPHVWFDVSLWKQTVRLVADRLADYDPKNARAYAKNARAYMTKLDALHDECQTELEKIPEGQRVMVTAHDAFHYFGKAYGIRVKAIQGVSTAAEASLKHVEALVDDMVENKIRAVF